MIAAEMEIYLEGTWNGCIIKTVLKKWFPLANARVKATFVWKSLFIEVEYHIVENWKCFAAVSTIVEQIFWNTEITWE